MVICDNGYLFYLFKFFGFWSVFQERFLFLFFFLKREHKEFLKMENVLVTVVKEITNEEQEDMEE